MKLKTGKSNLNLVPLGRLRASNLEPTDVPGHGCLSSAPQHAFLEPYHHRLYIFLDCGNNEQNANQYSEKGYPGHWKHKKVLVLGALLVSEQHMDYLKV